MLFGLKQFNRNRQQCSIPIMACPFLQVSNVSFADFDLDLTELGGPITWDGSDVPDTCLTPWILPPVG